MAQVVVRNIDEGLKARLKRRAARHGRSMEEEVRQILRGALGDEAPPATRLGSSIASRFAGKGLSDDLPEFHGLDITPMEFDSPNDPS